jgi:hypothetical protein
VKRRALLPIPLLIALPWLSGCTEEPNGPAIALVTVSDLPAEAGQAEGPLAPFLSSAARAPLVGPGTGPERFDPAQALGALLSRTALEPASGAPGRLVLGPERQTLFELEANAGLETASFVTDHAFDEEFGFQQGVFQAHDRAWIEINAEASWLATAIEGARLFLAEKLPRPMEDAPCVWLHLDLSLVEARGDRGAQLAQAIELLGAELERRADQRLILVALPRSPGDLSLLAARGPGLAAGESAPLEPAAAGQRLLEWIGHADIGGVARPIPTADSPTQRP